MVSNDFDYIITWSVRIHFRRDLCATFSKPSFGIFTKNSKSLLINRIWHIDVVSIKVLFWILKHFLCHIFRLFELIIFLMSKSNGREWHQLIFLVKEHLYFLALFKLKSCKCFNIKRIVISFDCRVKHLFLLRFKIFKEMEVRQKVELVLFTHDFLSSLSSRNQWTFIVAFIKLFFKEISCLFMNIQSFKFNLDKVSLLLSILNVRSFAIDSFSKASKQREVDNFIHVFDFLNVSRDQIKKSKNSFVQIVEHSTWFIFDQKILKHKTRVYYVRNNVFIFKQLIFKVSNENFENLDHELRVDKLNNVILTFK